jgi:serine/threonine-protein phosphatase CPPED1
MKTQIKNYCMKLTILSVLFGIVIFISNAQPTRPFFFVQLADPQFGMYPLQRNFHKERQHLSQAVEAINELRPAFVVICGDLVNRVGDDRQIAAFKETIANLDHSIPLFLVAGNHDVGNTPTPTTLHDYRKIFGQDYYSFKHDGQRFVVLNSSLIKDPSRAQEDAGAQFNWLQAVLDTARIEHSNLIVFQHHPWFVKNSKEPNGYFNIPRKTRMKYLNLLENAGVSYVFAGHLHANASGTFKSLKMITSGPVGMPLGTSPSGIRIVIVRPTTIEHKYYALRNIPPRIDLSSTLESAKWR